MGLGKDQQTLCLAEGLLFRGQIGLKLFQLSRMRTVTAVVSQGGIRLDIMYARLVNSLDEFSVGMKLLGYQVNLLCRH